MGGVQVTISVRDQVLGLLLPSDDPHWIEEIVALGPATVLPVLIEVVLGDRVPAVVRGRAAITLGHLKDTRAAQPLVSLLDTSDDAVLKARAVQALGRIGEMAPTALTGLVGRLGDPDPYVRRVAADALGKSGLREALAHLESMAEQDEEELNRSAARSAIEKIERGA